MQDTASTSLPKVLEAVCSLFRVSRWGTWGTWAEDYVCHILHKSLQHTCCIYPVARRCQVKALPELWLLQQVQLHQTLRLSHNHASLHGFATFCPARVQVSHKCTKCVGGCAHAAEPAGPLE